MVDWDKHKVQLVHLGEKVIHIYSWKEGSLTQMMMKLQKELGKEEDALTRLHVDIQEH
jgi:hypothetical protein